METSRGEGYKYPKQVSKGDLPVEVYYKSVGCRSHLDPKYSYDYDYNPSNVAPKSC